MFKFLFLFFLCQCFSYEYFPTFFIFQKKGYTIQSTNCSELLGVLQFWWISPISQFAKFLSRYCLLPILNQSLIWKLFHLLSNLFHYSTIESTRKTSQNRKILNIKSSDTGNSLLLWLLQFIQQALFGTGVSHNGCFWDYFIICTRNQLQNQNQFCLSLKWSCWTRASFLSMYVSRY